MEDSEIQPLYDNYHRKIAQINLDFKRYLYDKINWNARMIGIKGADRNGAVVAAHAVSDDENVISITSDQQMVRSAVSGFRVQSRMAISFFIIRYPFVCRFWFCTAHRPCMRYTRLYGKRLHCARKSF